MQSIKTVGKWLEERHVDYEILEHPTAFTAMEIAEAQHLSGQQVIKAVIVETDQGTMMCVLPAIHVIDFEKFKKALGLKEAALLEEAKAAHLFPGSEVGAMAPIGKLANLPLYLDESLKENQWVAFNGGTHQQLIKMRFKDYLKVAEPIFLDFGKHISQWKKVCH